ncbi:GNAT family N-acetyltransferase [Muricoccus radiodurans]|uniref:GNAT family N-acetyltransferase n=1 Tax=Muricoccus radiodurans TaxID=2231721 RepID=UPI003CF63286
MLRAIEESDLDPLHAWGNDPEIWQRLGGWHFPTSRRDTAAWVARASDAANQRFAVTLDGALVGTANLVEIDWKNRHAFHGMMLGSIEARGRGVGTDTVMAVMRYAFDELGLERLDGAIIEGHAASIALYCRRCGWQVEGRQRRWYFRQGQWFDRLLVGVTREDYAALLAERRYWD